MESRKYWTSKTNSTVPTTDTQSTVPLPTTKSNPETITKYLFASSTQDETELQTNLSDFQPSLETRPAKRSSNSFSSTSSSFDSDSGMQLQDDMMTSESMMSLLTNNDPIMMESETDMEVPENSGQLVGDVFMPKAFMHSCKGTDNHTLKALLVTPSSPVNKVATPDTTTTGYDDLISTDIQELHPVENAIADATLMSNMETPLLDSHVNEPTNEEKISQILGNSSVSSTQASSTSEILLNLNNSDQPSDTNSQSVIDKLLGLKTLFKDPKHTTEFKTDYLKGFSTEKQDCESIITLFNSIQHPADALDIALARADDENLSKLIDQTIEAFDKQNFLTRGFLAKLPDYQHRFLVGP